MPKTPPKPSGRTPILPADVTVKRNPRARRLILRLAQRGDGIEVVAPRRVSQREIAQFVALNNDWIAQHRAARPPQVAFAEGNTILFRGEPYRLARSSSLRGVVQREDGQLIFSCLQEHLPRRVTDFLIREARLALLHSLTRHALTMGVKLPKFTVRDTSTRWGSCSSSGTLSFSWRLIMAPPDVLDYVAAHELAHLRHMNHGARFWALCEKLAPQTDSAKQWLSDNGPALHRYG